jgi:quinol monooxygenase YgiN
LTSKPGERDALTAVLRQLVAGTEDEPGTLTYVMYHDVKDENVVWFYERYESQEALDAHSRSDTMLATLPELRPLLDGRTELTFLSVVAGKGL